MQRRREDVTPAAESESLLSCPLWVSVSLSFINFLYSGVPFLSNSFQFVVSEFSTLIYRVFLPTYNHFFHIVLFLAIILIDFLLVNDIFNVFSILILTDLAAVFQYN